MAADRRCLLMAGLLALPLLAAAPAAAEEHKVTISHLEFDPTRLEVKEGDTITFVNKSDIAHNLYLTYEDGSMTTLDTQVPGTSRTAVLEQSGRVVVRCWIHPVIRLDLEVAPAG